MWRGANGAYEDLATNSGASLEPNATNGVLSAFGAFGVRKCRSPVYLVGRADLLDVAQ
jgi:hypothetical protein